MCGIVGLFAKHPEIEARLGEHLSTMLVQMSDRGPDSAGVAVYRDPAPAGSSKLTLFSADPREDWPVLGAALGVSLLVSLPREALMTAIGIFTLSYAAWQLYDPVNVKPIHHYWAAPAGFAGAAAFCWDSGFGAHPAANTRPAAMTTISFLPIVNPPKASIGADA